MFLIYFVRAFCYDKDNKSHLIEASQMKLKSNADISAFMAAVQLCRRDVWFDTPAGDRLNLKSALSQFIFIAAAAERSILAEGTITCASNQDMPKLLPYLEDRHAD